MKKLIPELFLHIFIFIFALCTAQPALAHGSEPRLEISVERINPGEGLDVRGVDFDYEQSVTLYLERTGILIQLGEILTDLEGVFVQNVVLPVDLPEGVYNVRAVADHHEVVSPALTVQGALILDDGRVQAGRDEHEGFSAPVPTIDTSIAPVEAPPLTVQPIPQTIALEPPASKRSSTTLIYSILLGIGIITLVAVRMVRNK